MLYHNALIITVDARRRILRDGALLVEGSRIREIGRSEELLAAYLSAERVDCKGDIMLPGLINSHMHLAQDMLKGLADDMPLMPWLTQRVWPIQGAYTNAQYLTSARLSMAEMLLSGTTTFVESMIVSRYGMEGLVEAVAQSGMRGMLAKVVMEPIPGQTLPASMTESWEASFGEALEAKRKWDGAFDDRVRIWLGPRWTAMFNDRLMGEVSRYMEEYGFYSTLHFSEEPADVQAILNSTGKSPAAYLRAKGVARKEMLLIHCTHLPEGDEALLGEDGVSVAYCPISNMKTALGVCRAYDMIQRGVNVALGTDAQACDNNADMVLAMRIGNILQKHIHGDSTVMPAEQAVEMATINGARAIGMEKEIGSLEKGKRADFILLDLSRPRLRPAPNPVAAAVYSATGDCVRTVVVNGRPVVRDYRLLTMDAAALIEDAERTRHDMCAALNIDIQGLTRWPYSL